MSTGTGPNLTGDKIASIFDRAGYLARSAFTEGMVAVAWNGTGADMFDACLPNDADAYNAGRAFLGIWMNAGTATSGTDHGPLQKLGVAQCRLKANTACQTGQIAAYDPADGGLVVPWTNAKQVPIGRFSQTKASSSGVQFVGVELDAAIAGGPTEMLVGAVTTTSTALSANAETAFDQSVTIPANLLSVGSVVTITVGCRVPVGATADTLTLRLRWGGLTGTVLCATSAVNVAANDIWAATIVVTIRSATTATFTGWLSTPAAVGTAAPLTVKSAGAVAISTIASATDIVGTADWSADTTDTVVLEDMTVKVARPTT